MNKDFNGRLCSIVMSFIIMLLCYVDAINTMYILSHGGTELNPLMNTLLERDLSLFVMVKQIMTLLFLSFLTYHKKYKIIAMLLVVYTALLAYQIAIIWSM